MSACCGPWGVMTFICTYIHKTEFSHLSLTRGLKFKSTDIRRKNVTNERRRRIICALIPRYRILAYQRIYIVKIFLYSSLIENKLEKKQRVNNEWEFEITWTIFCQRAEECQLCGADNPVVRRRKAGLARHITRHNLPSSCLWPIWSDYVEPTMTSLCQHCKLHNCIWTN